MNFQNSGNFAQEFHDPNGQNAQFGDNYSYQAQVGCENDMQEMPSNPNQREHFMKINRSTQDVMESLKKQCFDRIKSKRKSILDARRRLNIQQVQSMNQQFTETKQKKMSTQVNNEIAQDTEMIEEIIRKEILNIHQSGDVDQWAEEYDQITKELNQYLVQQLMDESKWDEELCYIKEQNFTKMALEMHAMANSEEDSGKVYVCAICKMGYVHKLRPPCKSKQKVLEKPIVRLTCENQGCLDVNFQVDADFDDSKLSVEVLMNQLNGTVMDHDQHKEERLNQSRQLSSEFKICENQRDLRVEIQEINDDMDQDMVSDENAAANGQNDQPSSQQKCFVISCANCDFIDFSPINL